MKAIVLQSHFAKGVGQVSRTVSSRTTLPVLGNILIVAKKGKLELKATDLEVGVVTVVPGKVEEEGELTVPARLLSDFVTNNSDESIEITAKENEMTLKSARYEARIAGISAEEFPTIPNVPKAAFASFKRDEFQDAIKKVVIAPATDETRPTLAGVYFEFHGKKLVLAATDSYRLAEVTLSLEESHEDKKMIVPARTMTEVLRLVSSADAKEVVVAMSENQVFFTIGDTRLVSRTIEGSFPNYSQIVPKDFSHSAVVDFKELLSALKMTALFAKDAANNITVAFKDKEVVVTSAQAQSGSAASHLSAETSGGDISISFNARYVLDALSAYPADRITIKLNDSASPGVFEFGKDKNYLYIVMPLKMD